MCQDDDQFDTVKYKYVIIHTIEIAVDELQWNGIMHRFNGCRVVVYDHLVQLRFYVLQTENKVTHMLPCKLQMNRLICLRSN